jgi:Zn-dependent protease
MPQRSRFTLLTIRGIPIGVDWSWFFVLFLIIWLLSSYYRDILGSSQDSLEPYTLAILTAAGFFASIVLHELGHAVIAQRNRIAISSITLWMFGGIASLDREPESAGAEFRIAAAGPAVTLVITALCIGVGAAINGGSFWDEATLSGTTTVSTSVAVLAWLANINGAILLFNLLPAFPLDGGRIVRSIAWRVSGDRDRATIFSARLGQGFAYAFIAIGIVILLAGNLVGGVWLALIGWMLGGSARASANQSKLNTKLGGLRVADVMDSEPVAIPAGTTVDQALDEYFMRYRWPWFPVVDPGEHFLGLLNRGTADAVPETIRRSQTVSEIIDPGGSTDQTVKSDEPLESLLANLELRRLGGLAAVDADGRLAGVVTLEQVGRALRDAAAGRST